VVLGVCRGSTLTGHVRLNILSEGLGNDNRRIVSESRKRFHQQRQHHVDAADQAKVQLLAGIGEIFRKTQEQLEGCLIDGALVKGAALVSLVPPIEGSVKVLQAVQKPDGAVRWIMRDIDAMRAQLGAHIRQDHDEDGDQALQRQGGLADMVADELVHGLCHAGFAFGGPHRLRNPAARCGLRA
jgi:hypothetical protein